MEAGPRPQAGASTQGRPAGQGVAGGTQSPPNIAEAAWEARSALKGQDEAAARRATDALLARLAVDKCAPNQADNDRLFGDLALLVMELKQAAERGPVVVTSPIFWRAEVAALLLNGILGHFPNRLKHECVVQLVPALLSCCSALLEQCNSRGSSDPRLQHLMQSCCTIAQTLLTQYRLEPEHAKAVGNELHKFLNNSATDSAVASMAAQSLLSDMVSRAPAQAEERWGFPTVSMAVHLLPPLMTRSPEAAAAAAHLAGLLGGQDNIAALSLQLQHSMGVEVCGTELRELKSGTFVKLRDAVGTVVQLVEHFKRMSTLSPRVHPADVAAGGPSAAAPAAPAVGAAADAATRRQMVDAALRDMGRSLKSLGKDAMAVTLLRNLPMLRQAVVSAGGTPDPIDRTAINLAVAVSAASELCQMESLNLETCDPYGANLVIAGARARLPTIHDHWNKLQKELEKEGRDMGAIAALAGILRFYMVEASVLQHDLLHFSLDAPVRMMLASISGVQASIYMLSKDEMGGLPLSTFAPGSSGAAQDLALAQAICPCAANSFCPRSFADLVARDERTMLYKGELEELAAVGGAALYTAYHRSIVGKIRRGETLTEADNTIKLALHPLITASTFDPAVLYWRIITEPGGPELVGCMLHAFVGSKANAAAATASELGASMDSPNLQAIGPEAERLQLISSTVLGPSVLDGIEGCGRLVTLGTLSARTWGADGLAVINHFEDKLSPAIANFTTALSGSGTLTAAALAKLPAVAARSAALQEELARLGAMDFQQAAAAPGGDAFLQGRSRKIRESIEKRKAAALRSVMLERRELEAGKRSVHGLAEVAKAPYSNASGYMPLLQAVEEVRKEASRGSGAARAELLGTAPADAPSLGSAHIALNPGAVAFAPRAGS